MRPPMENPDLVHQEAGNPQSSTYPRPVECDSGQTIQTGTDHSDGMIPPSRGIQSHMYQVASSQSGSVC